MSSSATSTIALPLTNATYQTASNVPATTLSSVRSATVHTTSPTQMEPNANSLSALIHNTMTAARSPAPAPSAPSSSTTNVDTVTSITASPATPEAAPSASQNTTRIMEPANHAFLIVIPALLERVASSVQMVLSSLMAYAKIAPMAQLW